MTVEGSGEDFTVNDGPAVVCGNVQTANATVYVIDGVLAAAVGRLSRAPSQRAGVFGAAYGSASPRRFGCGIRVSDGFGHPVPLARATGVSRS